MNQWLWGSLLLGWLNLSVLTPENRAIALHLSPLPWYVHIHCLPFLAPNQMSCDLQGLSSCHRAGLVFFSERQSCDEQSSLLAHVWLVFRHLVFKRKNDGMAGVFAENLCMSPDEEEVLDCLSPTLGLYCSPIPRFLLVSL